MIRTHHPRGHLWNCASAFQRTIGYREIDFDDAPVTNAAIIVPDPEAELGPSERAVKRRRLERLADDFISGADLEIHSARTIARAPARFRVATDGPTWEDVLTDREYLGSYERQRVGLRPRNDKVSQIGVDVCEIEAPRRAHCRAPSGDPRVRILTAPTMGAILETSEPDSSDHGAQNILSAATIMTSAVHPSASEGTTMDTDIGSSATIPTAAWTSSKWLRTGAFVARGKRVNEDCSRDELGMTSIASSGQSGPMAASAKLPEFSTGRRQQGTIHSVCFAQQTDRLQSSVEIDFEESSACVSRFEGDQSERPLSSVRPVSLMSTGTHQQHLWRQCKDGLLSRTSTSVGDVIHGSLSDPVTLESHFMQESRFRPRRRLKRRRSAPAQSQVLSEERNNSHAEHKRRATSFQPLVQVAFGNEASPFVFRKRKSHSTRAPLSKQSDCLLHTKMQAFSGSAGDRNAASAQSWGPSGEALNGRSESNSAPLTSFDWHSARSIPVSGEYAEGFAENLALADKTQHSAETPIANNDTQTWPGTQALLAQAQRTLFSPARPGTAEQDSMISIGSAAGVATPEMRRSAKPTAPRPLLALSQGNMPSTQALLDGWQGWSTIKKPRGTSHSKDYCDSPALDKSDPATGGRAGGTCRSGPRASMSQPVPSTWDF